MCPEVPWVASTDNPLIDPDATPLELILRCPSLLHKHVHNALKHPDASLGHFTQCSGMEQGFQLLFSREENGVEPRSRIGLGRLSKRTPRISELCVHKTYLINFSPLSGRLILFPYREATRTFKHRKPNQHPERMLITTEEVIQ